MAIDSKIPELVLFKEDVEKYFGKPLILHSDFERLRDDIIGNERTCVGNYIGKNLRLFHPLRRFSIPTQSLYTFLLYARWQLG